MSFLLGVVIFVVAMLVSIMLHEAGHFLTAKKFRMKVTQFFVGFGQTLWSRQRGETEYGVKVLPLGGYVKILGMTALEDVDPADEPRSFRRQPGWQRAIVLVAGSFMHFVLALVLLFFLAVAVGVPDTTTIAAVSPCVPATVKAMDLGRCAKGLPPSPARRAGIRPGDTIISVAGQNAGSSDPWGHIGDVIRRQPAGKPVPVVVDRDGRDVTLSVTPATVPGRKGSYLGIDEVIFNRFGLVSAAAWSGSEFGTVIAESGHAAARLPGALPHLFAKNRASVPGGTVSSVVGAADAAGQVVAAGGGWQFTVTELLSIVISLNVFVGIFNLLPLLPLDGGHLAIVIYERARAAVSRRRGRPDPGLVDMRKLIPVSLGFFAVLVGLSLVLIAADLINPVKLPI
jgi:membrane-associated protease RseP (regulator of RpoE activity)